MKTVVRYAIYKIENSDYSNPINYTQRLRDRKRALRIVKKLRALGHNVHAAPMRIAA